MRLFGMSPSLAAPDLRPDWLLELPSRLSGGRCNAPRFAFLGDTLVCWAEGQAAGIDPDAGSLLWRAKLGGWEHRGFGPGGEPLFRRQHVFGVLDPATGKVDEASGLEPAPVRVARDAPEEPEQDPRLEVADRLLRVWTETRCRVTRHTVEVTDMGTAPLRTEVASFTMRSDRLAMFDLGGGRLYGSVGADDECPAGAVAGSSRGPLAVLRRVFPAWHEHGIPITEPDLVGHGPARLVATVLQPGSAAPRGRELGTLPELWEGLGWRGGAHPPWMASGWGARPIGLHAGRLYVELTELANGRPNSPGGLTPRARYVAAFGVTDLLD